MKIQLISHTSRQQRIVVSRKKKNEEMAQFAATQLRALQHKKLRFPVQLGHL